MGSRGITVTTRMNIFKEEMGELTRVYIDELLAFSKAIRENHSTLIGYVSRLRPSFFIIRGALFNTAQAILAYLPSDLPEPPENARVELQVTWKNTYYTQPNGNITRQKQAYVHTWKLLPRPFKPLPYSYSEFLELYWNTLQVDFQFKEAFLSDYYDLQELLLSNIISSPPIEYQTLGGIFTTHLIPPQAKTISQRVLARIRNLTPQFIGDVNIQNQRIKLSYFNLQTLHTIRLAKKFQKQRTAPQNTLQEISVNHTLLIRNPSYFEADLVLALPGTMTIPKTLPETFTNAQYEIARFLVSALYNTPILNVQDEHLLTMIDRTLETSVNQYDFPLWVHEKRLINKNRLTQQLTRLAMNDARKDAKPEITLQKLNDETDKLLRITRLTADIVETSQTITNKGKTKLRITGLQDALLKLFIDMESTGKPVTYNALLTNAYNTLKSPKLRIEKALENLIEIGMLYQVQSRGVKYLKRT